jgi:hypothetical protein
MLFPISYFLFPILIFLFSHCSEIKGCKEQCKNKTRDCTLKYQLLSRTISGSTVSTGRTTTGSEVEPNDTFQDSYKSTANGIGASVGNSFIQSATISSSYDIDIFVTSSGDGSSRKITQQNNLDKVTCNAYLKNNSLTRDSIPKLQTPTSTPDSSFTFQGKLNPSFSFSYVSDGAVAYIICSGTANTDYSLKTDVFIASNSSSSISLLSSYTDYSYVNICKGATKTCETKCSRGF